MTLKEWTEYIERVYLEKLHSGQAGYAFTWLKSFVYTYKEGPFPAYKKRSAQLLKQAEQVYIDIRDAHVKAAAAKKESLRHHKTKENKATPTNESPVKSVDSSDRLAKEVLVAHFGGNADLCEDLDADSDGKVTLEEWMHWIKRTHCNKGMAINLDEY